MIDLRVTKKRFKEHLYYTRWQYLLFAIGALIVFGLIYTVTRPVVDKEYRININIIAMSLDEKQADMWEDEILKLLTPDQQQVSITYSPLDIEDETVGYKVYEVLIAKMAVGEDDIYLMSKEMYDDFARQGAFLSLDEFANNYNWAYDIDIEEYKCIAETQDDEDRHLYGLPLDNVLGLNELGVDPTGMVASILVSTENEDNAKTALEYIMGKTD